jgi:hypothetical protein
MSGVVSAELNYARSTSVPKSLTFRFLDQG